MWSPWRMYGAHAWGAHAVCAEALIQIPCLLALQGTLGKQRECNNTHDGVCRVLAPTLGAAMLQLLA